MTTSQSPGPSELRFGNQRLRDILQGGLADHVDDVLAALGEQIDLYGALPAEAMGGDIAAVIGRNLRLFVDSLRSGRPPDPGDLEEIRLSAARRAEERIPLELMLRAYPIGARVVFERATEAAGPDDVAAVREVVVLLLDFLSQVMSAAAGGYLEEHQMIVGAAESNEQRLLQSLVRGTFDPLVAESASIEVPDAFDVVALSMPAHPDELQPGIDAAIAARRKVRRLDAELRRSHDGVLTSLTNDGGIVLVAVDETIDPDGPRTSAGRVAMKATGTHTAVEIDLAVLADAAGVPLTAAVARAQPSGVAPALRQAREVLQLVQWLGVAPGLYRLEDVLVEYQLSRPGPARQRLAQRVAAIEHDPDLLATVRAYLVHGGNRRRVALDLHIHPNTVDYRNAKVHRLTGLDPTDAGDAYQLRTALIAHDAERAAVGAGDP